MLYKIKHKKIECSFFNFSFFLFYYWPEKAKKKKVGSFFSIFWNADELTFFFFFFLSTKKKRRDFFLWNDRIGCRVEKHRKREREGEFKKGIMKEQSCVFVLFFCFKFIHSFFFFFFEEVIFASFFTFFL